MADFLIRTVEHWDSVTGGDVEQLNVLILYSALTGDIVNHSAFWQVTPVVK
jgi:hypothetical protein